MLGGIKNMDVLAHGRVPDHVVTRRSRFASGATGTSGCSRSSRRIARRRHRRPYPGNDDVMRAIHFMPKGLPTPSSTARRSTPEVPRGDDESSSSTKSGKPKVEAKPARKPPPKNVLLYEVRGEPGRPRTGEDLDPPRVVQE